MMEKLQKDGLFTLFNGMTHEAILLRAYYEPAHDFLVRNINRGWKTVDVRKVFSSPDFKKRASQTFMVAFCTWFYRQQEVMEVYFASFSAQEQKLMQEATWVSSVPWQRINELFESPVIRAREQSRHSYGNTFSLELDVKLLRWRDFVAYDQTWHAVDTEDFLNKAKVRFELPPVLRMSFASMLPKPDGYELKPYGLKKNEMVFSAEEAIFRELPLVITHYIQGNIRYTQKGYPVASSSRKMQTALQLLAFPGNDEPALRAMLLAGTLFEHVNMETSLATPLAVLSALFDDAGEYCPIPLLLDYLKGARNLHLYQCNDEATVAVLGVCSLMNTTDWFSLENIKTYLDTHFIDFEPLHYLDTSLRYQEGGRELHLERKDMEERINGPALAAHFYWLAAFGVVELAIDCHDPCRYSWYDGLRACRLTGLGAHLFGMQKEYTPPKSESDVKLTFDEHNLVIVAEGNLALADTMLHNYAVRAGDNHYQLSPGKFLKDCRSENDLKNKIDLFKRTVGGTLPPFWESSLKRMRDNSGAISPKKDMRIYELPAGDKELHRLVAQDQQLRPFIIKAEKFHVLIAENDASRFTERMKELGYLIG